MTQCAENNSVAATQIYFRHPPSLERRALLGWNLFSFFYAEQCSAFRFGNKPHPRNFVGASHCGLCRRAKFG
jgi:hypothetical protein